MTFADADEELELHWGMGGNGGYQDRLDEWTRDGERLADVTIAGHQAEVFQAGSSAGSVDLVALWPDGDYGVEIRGDFADLDAFLAVAATIEVVDVDTWLSAMPASVVRPESRAAAVEQILADIPLPGGLDPAELAAGDGSVSDRYQLGARVTGPVACGWIEQWVDATRTGDVAATQEAVDAMATSHEWDILLEMEDDGAWSQILWEFADAMASNGTMDAGRPDMPIADLYVDTFGCDTP
jgi:hypothetical protein